MRVIRIIVFLAALWSLVVLLCLSLGMWEFWWLDALILAIPIGYGLFTAAAELIFENEE